MGWFKYRCIYKKQAHTMQTIMIHCEIPFTAMMWNIHYIFIF